MESLEEEIVVIDGIADPPLSGAEQGAIDAACELIAEKFGVSFDGEPWTAEQRKKVGSLGLALVMLALEG